MNPILVPNNTPIDPTKTHYIVAYGSLIEQASKDRACKNEAPNIPVLVQGYRREWTNRDDLPGFNSTFLGVMLDPNSNFNGVMFALPQSDNLPQILTQFDEWEYTYERQEVSVNNIQILAATHSHLKLDAGKMVFWIYVNFPLLTAPPSNEFPICQSYVDIFLAGCFEIEEKYGLQNFVKMAVETTKGWCGEFWINDRIFPRRPFIHQLRARSIDTLLKELVPLEFAKIKIE